MKRDATFYIWIGFWLFLLPFLGIPGRWKEILTALTALGILSHALFIYLHRNEENEPHLSEKESSDADSSNTSEIS